MSDFQYTETRTGGFQEAYGRSRDIYEVDVMMYGTHEMHEQVQARIVAMFKAKHVTVESRPGATYFGHVQYVGLVSTVEQPNPYSEANPRRYGVYRFIFETRTSGTD
jgi:hypothetical protein